MHAENEQEKRPPKTAVNPGSGIVSYCKPYADIYDPGNVISIFSWEKLVKDWFIVTNSTTVVEKSSSKVTNFDINLDDYDSAEKLESLGLDCLKHALEGFF